jgi:tetratricopeptide (TPR) repeat protein
VLTEAQRILADRIFSEVLAVPEQQRRDWLDGNCQDSVVRCEVESLLAFATRPLEGISEAVQQVAGSLAEPDFLGQRVGAYRLSGRIGRGGMGAVYRAVRDDDQFRQTVAIKMLRFPDGDPSLLRRFRYERQILASLEHPNISRLLDGGSWTPPGSTESQPYIVMEYVEGLPLTIYCEEKKLDVRQRLRLFQQICEAVSYAHRQLVIHRDIKPANILVTAEGTPKLLDFGVAKLLNTESIADAGTMTATAQPAMTPDYASPEQVRGEAVSTATDVYSLGAVLYELLTGRRPRQLSTHDPLEIAREICEREVARPNINSELDVILLKALQTAGDRRYRSVEQFSEDIRRYLEGLPILARPDTLGYRAGKFVRRHRLGLAAVAALFVVLVGGIATSLWQARRADTEAATARAVNEFLQSDLLSQAGASTQSGPGIKPDPDLKVRTALDRAAARITGKFERTPLVEASIRQTIGDAYKDLGLLPDAQGQLERAFELRRTFLGSEHVDSLRTLSDLGELYWTQGKRAQVETLWNGLVDAQRRVLGEKHPDTLNTMSNLAALAASQGKSDRAEALYNGVLEAQRMRLGERHYDTLATMNNLGALYTNVAKFGPAEELLTKTLETLSQVLGPEHPNTLMTMNNLAKLYGEQGNYDSAAKLFTQVLDVQRRVLGEEHPLPLTTMSNLAKMCAEQGKQAQADALYTRVVEIRRRVLGKNHPSTLAAMNNLGFVYRNEGRYSQAEALHNTVFEVQRRVLGEEHRDALVTRNYLGLLYDWEGQYSKAEAVLTKLLEARRRVLGPRQVDTIKVLVSLGAVQFQQHKYAAAEPLLREAVSYFENTKSNDWTRYRCQSLLGASLAGQKRYAEAEPLLLVGYEGMLQRKATIPAYAQTAVPQARAWLARLYNDWGKPQQAAQWQAKLHIETAIPPVL